MRKSLRKSKHFRWSNFETIRSEKIFSFPSQKLIKLEVVCSRNSCSQKIAGKKSCRRFTIRLFKCYIQNLQQNLIFFRIFVFFCSKKIVITVICFGTLAENFLSSKNYLLIYGVNFTMEPLQNARYLHQCGSYDEMIDFRHFFRTFIRHISTPITSWWKIFCMCVALSYYASHKNFRPNACGCLWC